MKTIYNWVIGFGFMEFSFPDSGLVYAALIGNSCQWLSLGRSVEDLSGVFYPGKDIRLGSKQ